MTIDELIAVDPLLGSKVSDDMDFHEVRGEDRELIVKWIEKALLIEATLFMIRSQVLDITGVKKDKGLYEPTFRFKPTIEAELEERLGIEKEDVTDGFDIDEIRLFKPEDLDNPENN